MCVCVCVCVYTKAAFYIMLTQLLCNWMFCGKPPALTCVAALFFVKFAQATVPRRALSYSPVLINKCLDCVYISLQNEYLSESPLDFYLCTQVNIDAG